MPIDRRRLQVISVLVSEDLRQEATGLQTIVGLMSGNMLVQAFPAMMPKMVIRIEFESKESYLTRCHLRVIDPDGLRAVDHSDAFHVRHEMRNIFAVAASQISITKPGRYQIDFGTDPSKLREVGWFHFASAQPAPS